jgi:hypothetical protein
LEHEPAAIVHERDALANKSRLSDARFSDEPDHPPAIRQFVHGVGQHPHRFATADQPGTEHLPHPSSMQSTSMNACR